MKKYELWIDETGDFSAQEQIEGSKKDKVYSIIGGVLAPMDCISVNDAWKLVGNEVGHATELGKAETSQDLVPALRTLKEKGAEFVFFENRKRYTRDNKIDLYMEMMADGIMQLVSFLAVFDKEFQLDIMIAVRYVEEQENVLTKIPYEEYSIALKNILMERIRYGYMGLDEDIKINILFASARQEPKLMLADYACGARRASLREHDNRYTKEEKAELKRFFDENYIFDSYEYSIMGQVKRKLSENCLAEAILILCNDKHLQKDLPAEYLEENGTKLNDKIKWLIFSKMAQLGKLEIRCQLEELLGDIYSSIQLEDEYEWGETFLSTIKNEFLDELKKYEIHDDKLDLMISFAYASLYLKEGDMKNLEEELERAEESLRRLPQSLDYLWEQFRIWTLRQACCLYSCDFEGAKKWEELIEVRVRELEEVLVCAGIWEEGAMVPNQFQKETMRLKEMRIYLELQHGTVSAVEAEEELEPAIERVNQSSMDEISLFPRACYYYMADTGRTVQALSWLVEFVGLEPMEWNANINIIKENTRKFCRILAEMDGRQKNELVREYIYLMKKMREFEMYGMAANTYSEILYQSMEAESLLQIIGKEIRNQVELRTHAAIHAKSQYRHLIRSVLNDYQDKIYHPTEQIWWLMSSYYRISGKNQDVMNNYYNKAVQICEQSPEYALMQKNLLVMKAEHAGRKLSEGTKKSSAEINKVKTAYKTAIESPAMTDAFRSYLEREWAVVLSMIENGVDSEVIGYELENLAKRMAL